MENDTITKTASQRLGENVARLRAQREWRIEDLAEQTKLLGPSHALSISTISRIETQNTRVANPRAVRVEELETFATVFAVAVQDLLSDSSSADAKRFEAERTTYLAEMNQARLHTRKANEALDRMRKFAGVDEEFLEYALHTQHVAEGTYAFLDSIVAGSSKKKTTKKGGK